MPRYVALLRGVNPMNCKMQGLRAWFEAAGFVDVRTVLSSGNVAFSTPQIAPWSTFEYEAEQAMLASMGRTFPTIVRSAAHLQALVGADPFGEFTPLPPTAKRVVTFLRHPSADGGVTLPLERDGAPVLKRAGTEVFTVYEPNPKGPVFMTLLERTFGKDITTRTLATVEKCATAWRQRTAWPSLGIRPTSEHSRGES